MITWSEILLDIASFLFQGFINSEMKKYCPNEVKNYMTVILLVKDAGYEPNFVIPTQDHTMFLQFHSKRYICNLEVEPDLSSMGLKIEDKWTGEKKFSDHDLETLKQCLEEL